MQSLWTFLSSTMALVALTDYSRANLHHLGSFCVGPPIRVSRSKYQSVEITPASLGWQYIHTL